MSKSVRKTIYLPALLAGWVEKQARAEHKSFSSVVQEALVAARATRLTGELSSIQDFWSRRAKAKGIFTERELERYLGG